MTHLKRWLNFHPENANAPSETNCRRHPYHCFGCCWLLRVFWWVLLFSLFFKKLEEFQRRLRETYTINDEVEENISPIRYFLGTISRQFRLSGTANLNLGCRQRLFHFSIKSKNMSRDYLPKCTNVVFLVKSMFLSPIYVLVHFVDSSYKVLLVIKSCGHPSQ